MRWDVRAFDLFAPLYDLVMPPADEDAVRKGLFVADREIDRIVEIGGGSGRVARTVGATVVDPAAGMLRRARRRGLETVQGSATDLPHPDGSVDAVLVVDALHHIADQRGVVEEAKRALAPGGVLVVSDFDPTTLLGHLLVWGEHLVGFESTFHQPDRLRETLASVGFEAGVVERGFGYTVVGRVPESV
jgi:demethylmenaquinone methyltransferase/2-methoxy-6-polyprenyl-1,4-benzoquinol methylase